MENWTNIKESKSYCEVKKTNKQDKKLMEDLHYLKIREVNMGQSIFHRLICHIVTQFFFRD